LLALKLHPDTNRGDKVGIRSPIRDEEALALRRTHCACIALRDHVCMLVLTWMYVV
jgi:hypothetical protein